MRDALCIALARCWHVSRMTIPPFSDRPPQTGRVNEYDERHLATYIRLLDADDGGADWREVVLIIFGIDPAHDHDRAKIVHDSHLARARWMTEAGYKHLLEPRLQ
jgi:hypothetical protein